MRLRFLPLVLAVLASITAPIAAGAVPSTALSTVYAAIARANANDPAGLQRSFSADAPVVDNFPPFVWTGPNAAQRWWSAIDALMAKVGGSSLHAIVGRVETLKISGGDAYAVIALRVTHAFKGKTVVSNGLWTLTLHRFGSGWKITSAVWSDQ